MFKQPARKSSFIAAFVAAIALSGCGRAPDSVALPVGAETGAFAPTYSGATGIGGTITGRIVDQVTQAGIPGVMVQVQNVSNTQPVQTDAGGNFTLQNVPQGQQIISVNKQNYVYLATTGSIIANVVVNQAVALPQISLAPAVSAASNSYLTSIGGLTEPYGLAVDNNHGFLYCVDRIGLNTLVDKRCEVKKFTLAGGVVSKFGGSLLSVSKAQNASSLFDLFTHLNWSYGVDVDAGGNVYVAEANKDRVVKFSADGTYIANVKTGISNDYDVALTAQGTMAVSSGGNNKVLLFDVNLSSAGHDFSGTAGMPAVNGGFRGMAVDNSNYLYLIDQSASQGLAIKKYTATGGVPVLQFGTNNGSGSSQFSGASDLAIDNRNGDIYVTDTGNNRVQRFSRDGKFVGEFGTAGRGAGQFDRPFGIAIDKDGYIYVGDTGNKRIQKFAPGRITDGSTYSYQSNTVYYPTK